MRQCESCNECCKVLVGAAHGNPFGPSGIGKRDCVFLCQGRCSIYETRPIVCKRYQCAWSQGIFPDSIPRPDLCGSTISVETSDKAQYLKCVSVGPSTIKKQLEDWCLGNNTHVVFVEL